MNREASMYVAGPAKNTSPTCHEVSVNCKRNDSETTDSGTLR